MTERRAAPTGMTPERWTQVESLIDTALDLPLEERQAYIARLASDNATLGEEVRQLVIECERGDSVLDVGAGSLFPRLFGDEAAQDAMAELQSSLGAGYVLERELDGGGMSRVFVAYEAALGRRIVIKMLTPELAAGLSVERFEREIALAASLQQANIVTLLAAGRSRTLPYYSMPFIEGRSLRDRLAREGALPIRDAVNVLRDVARALSYAHERGVVHRDIKPGNILLSGGAAVVTDFGIAKALGEARVVGGVAAVTQRGVVLGTPAYMSPEQSAADPETDHRTDIYALGAVAYEMLTGKPPFAGRSPQELVAAHITEAPTPVDRDRPAIPRALATLVMQCLAKRPDDRPQSADDVLVALEAVASPIDSGVSAPSVTPAGRKRLTGLPVAASLTVAALFVASIIALVALRRDNADSLRPARIAIAPFENLTGDSTRNTLGLWIAEGVAVGLDQLDSVTLVSSQAAMIDGSGKLRRPTSVGAARAIGEETRAGRVIWGSYSLQGDSLRILAKIIDTRDGRVEQTFDPAIAAMTAPNSAIDELRDNVATALRASATKSMVGSIGHLPNLAAYQELIRAYELGIDAPDALPRLIKVAKLDTTFTLALYWLATAYADQGQWKSADSVVQVLSARRDRLSPVEQELLASIDAYAHADIKRDLVASRNLLKRDSTYINAAGVAMDAISVNQPQEALDVLQQNSQARADARDNRPSRLPQAHWTKMAIADHSLSRYQAEFAVATAGRARLGTRDQSWLFDRQVRALAALGDTSRLRQKVDSFVTGWNPAIHGRAGSPYRAATDPAQLYNVAALELSAHGLRREAMRYVSKGLAWHAGRADSDDERSEVFQTSLGELLMLAGRLDAARAIWAKLALHDTSYTGARILLAITAAQQGDSAAALQTMRVVDSLAKVPYAFGRPFVQEARIAAALGRKDDAVRFLQLALDGGTPFGHQWHCAPEFQVLRDFGPFKALLAPKG